jgi:hypothetical protein
MIPGDLRSQVEIHERCHQDQEIDGLKADLPHLGVGTAESQVSQGAPPYTVRRRYSRSRDLYRRRSSQAVSGAAATEVSRRYCDSPGRRCESRAYHCASAAEHSRDHSKGILTCGNDVHLLGLPG